MQMRTRDALLCEYKVGLPLDDVSAEPLDVFLLELQQASKVRVLGELHVGLALALGVSAQESKGGGRISVDGGTTTKLVNVG